MKKTGLLLVNLGTPQSAAVRDVRSYLREFLMDKNVIPLPVVLRWILVYGVITPFRSPKSAAAYQSIWEKEGSPLMVNSRRFFEKLKTQKIAEEMEMALSMRYGQPSIEMGVKQLIDSGVERIVVAALYPQYSRASTATVWEKVASVVNNKSADITVDELPPFYSEPEFIHVWHDVGKRMIETFCPEKVLFSFHGLPQQAILDEDTSGKICYQRRDCCEKPGVMKSFCYRHHCIVTAQELAKSLRLPEGRWEYSFQSRLGKQEWIQPYTQDRIEELARQGVRRILVFCPSFVADCLETLEEVAIGLNERFKQLGGEELQLVPCPNDSDEWVRGFSAIVQRYLAGHPNPKKAPLLDRHDSGQ